MDKHDKKMGEYYTIDLAHIFKSLFKKMWLLILAGIIAASCGFVYAKFFIAPTYSSSIMLYVNNSSFSLGGTSVSISASEISAAQSLVKTYSELLNNRTTLKRVQEKSGLKYTTKELSAMITAEPANETEIMRVTITANDAKHAAKIANTIAEVLPDRIAEIIDGASMEVVDSAIPNYEKIAPSVSQHTAVGFIIGFVLMAMIIAIVALMDDTIHDEEYILKTYDYPILAKIPDLVNVDSKKYGYYYKRGNE
jgi:capsular polysaccharide biosynthesis protein